MNTTHTSGPWHVIPDPAWVGKHPCHDARFIATCDMTGVEFELAEGQHGERPWRFENHKDSIICTMPDAENQKANARLIAAAPELLEALQAAWEHLQYCGYGDKWERNCAKSTGLDAQIRSAIDKATGGAL